MSSCLRQDCALPPAGWFRHLDEAQHGGGVRLAGQHVLLQVVERVQAARLYCLRTALQAQAPAGMACQSRLSLSVD